MKIAKYLYHPDFKKSIKKFPPKEKSKIINKIKMFLSDPYSSNLKTHKLTGKLNNYLSFSVSYRLRIMFRFVNDKTVEFIDIGGHGIYK